MTGPTPRLWHYTCSHGHARLGDRGDLVRIRDQVPAVTGWATTVVWATDLDTPLVLALGLTSYALSCDRTAHRYRVLEPERFEWWPAWSRRSLPPQAWKALESPPGTMPAHWWVSTSPAAAEYAPLVRVGTP